jgi:hypothetical protein
MGRIRGVLRRRWYLMDESMSEVPADERRLYWLILGMALGAFYSWAFEGTAHPTWWIVAALYAAGAVAVPMARLLVYGLPGTAVFTVLGTLLLPAPVLVFRPGHAVAVFAVMATVGGGLGYVADCRGRVRLPRVHHCLG